LTQAPSLPDKDAAPVSEESKLSPLDVKPTEIGNTEPAEAKERTLNDLIAKDDAAGSSLQFLQLDNEFAVSMPKALEIQEMEDIGMEDLLDKDDVKVSKKTVMESDIKINGKVF